MSAMVAYCVTNRGRECRTSFRVRLAKFGGEFGCRPPVSTGATGEPGAAAMCVSGQTRPVRPILLTNVTRWGMNGLMHRSKQQLYSITSSARASIDGSKARPRALAVLKFTTKSNLAGCSTGRLAGFAPRKILSTYSAARRYKSVKFGP